MSTRARVVTFIASVVLGTTAVIVLAHGISGSWAVGAGAGVIAGVLSGAMYSVIFRARS